MKDQEVKGWTKKTQEEIIDEFGRMIELMKGGLKEWQLINVYNQTFRFEHKFATVVLSGRALRSHPIGAEYTYEDFFETFICNDEIEIDIW